MYMYMCTSCLYFRPVFLFACLQATRHQSLNYGCIVEDKDTAQVNTYHYPECTRTGTRHVHSYRSRACTRTGTRHVHSYRSRACTRTGTCTRHVHSYQSRACTRIGTHAMCTRIGPSMKFFHDVYFVWTLYQVCCELSHDCLPGCRCATTSRSQRRSLARPSTAASTSSTPPSLLTLEKLLRRSRRKYGTPM